MVTGLPGTGKTSLAKEISLLTDASFLSSDKVRKELFKKPTYDSKEKDLVYRALFLLAKYIHATGKNCVIDASFFKEKLRKRAASILNSEKSQLKIIECACPDNVAIKRIKSRKAGYSDADESVFYKIKNEYEPISEKHITIDTSQKSPADCAKQAIAQLE
ncbi:MAG: AAA family ATPase [Nitrosopumilaceae archaeon]|nr:AAA family ATPase [Nitrosopumilaceae archaeon]NIU02459.1 AAA family ATPase [Nitrosopumilaceae archaeon]NIU88920.1 AAA family ATPase [Nitrosopumilaceae archaeon]NIV67031.1 AAA family ATPase [Nitrosopumilaceae archaeon]NIX63060.1 AAA family ATPase [Nitrosopumilaceae archaeon]